jgi:AcrR family transcriptional regulator
MTPSAPQPATSPSERRRSQHREEARRTILGAAETLLVEHGYEGFSMRRLASQCGYTAPTIYHYFRDKQGLLDAVLDERLALVVERLERLERRADAAETVREMLGEFARLGLENPAHHSLLAVHRPEGAAIPPSAQRIGDLFAELLGELGAAGRLREADVDGALQFVWMLLHGIVSLRSERPDVEWKQSIVEYSLDIAIQGLIGDLPDATCVRPERNQS